MKHFHGVFIVVVLKGHPLEVHVGVADELRLEEVLDHEGEAVAEVSWDDGGGRVGSALDHFREILHYHLQGGVGFGDRHAACAHVACDVDDGGLAERRPVETREDVAVGHAFEAGDPGHCVGETVADRFVIFEEAEEVFVCVEGVVERCLRGFLRAVAPFFDGFDLFGYDLQAVFGDPGTHGALPVVEEELGGCGVGDFAVEFAEHVDVHEVSEELLQLAYVEA